MRIIYFDICAIVLSMTVLAFFVSKKYTKGRTNRLILMLSLLFLLAGLFDVFDSLFGTYIPQSHDNALIQLISNSLFYIVRNLVIPAYILFVISYYGVWYKLKRNHLLLWSLAVPSILIVVLVVINAFTGFMFYIDTNGIYHRNSGLSVVYGIGGYFIIMQVILLLKYKKTVRNGEFVMLFSFIPLNLLAVIIQRMMPVLRVEMLAISLTLFMIATAVQRPEEVVDAVVGTLSTHAFLTDMYKAYSVDRPMNVVFIKIRNHRALRANLGLEIYDQVLRRVGEKLIQMGRIINLYTDVYYNGLGAFAIVTEGDTYNKTLDVARLVVAYLQESFKLSNLEIKLNAKVCLAELPKDLDSYQSLLRFNNTFHRTVPDMDQVILLSEIADSRDFKIKNEIDEIIKRGIEGNRFRM